MKKWMLVSIVLSLVLVLTACGNTQSASPTSTATTALSQEEQLLVGTIKLESTSQAVSAAQARELLPLWETLQSLASSGTAASQEVDSVVSQIKSTMSTEQISSIAAMNLTQQDLSDCRHGYWHLFDYFQHRPVPPMQVRSNPRQTQALRVAGTHRLI